MKIQKFKQYKESVESSDDIESSLITDNYIQQVLKATNQKIDNISGSVTESDSDLTFEMSDGNTIEIEHRYHPNGGPTIISVIGIDGQIGRKSVGYEGDSSNDEKYNNYDFFDSIYHMIKDIYIENGLLDATHYISLPTGDFVYETEEDGSNSVYFHSEEEANEFLEKIKKLTIKKLD